MMTPRAWRTSLGLGALCLVAPGAGAVSLGALEVRSAAGAPLDARIPVGDADSASLRGACFALVPRGPLEGASLELRRSMHGAQLLVRTRGPVGAGTRFAISLACPGAAALPAVEYSVRFASRAAQSLAIGAEALQAPPVRAPSVPLPVVARFGSRAGDTLAALARAIFPDQAQIRGRYIQAMRAANPDLARYGDDEALASGTVVALPDLHAFASTVAKLPAHRATRAVASAEPRAPKPAHHAAPPADAPAPSVAAADAGTRPSRARAAAPPMESARPAAQAGAFRLRLSAPALDLAPSAGMDAAKRAALRERLLVLDADDRMAQILAMRDDIRRLESQVSALKLRLATLNGGGQATAPAPAKAENPAPPAKVESPASPAKAESPESPAKAESPESPAKAENPAPPAEAKSNAEAAPAAPPEAHTTPAATHHGPVARPSEPQAEPWYQNIAWIAAALAAVLAAMLLLRAWRRRASDEEVYEAEAGDDTGVGEVALDTGTDPEPVESGEEEIASGEPAHDVATRVPAEDNVELRRRYMEERFPEIVNGALVLDDPRSVVRSARLLYDDGAIARAIELLHFAIEQDAAEMKPWLALFEIFRLQRLPGEFAGLARRFEQVHGASEEWAQVRAVGRVIDSDNPLYAGADYGAPDEAATQGWLAAPGDERRRPLAAELRSRLMADASVGEQDLTADPTPALRKAEIFSVA